MSDTKALRLKLFITLFWLATATLLVGKYYGHRFFQTPASNAVLNAQSDEEWMGIYKGIEKIGYSVTRTEKSEDGIKVSEHLLMNAMAMGEKKEIRMSITAVLNSGYTIKSFVFDVESDSRLKVEGKVFGNILNAVIDTGGIKLERKVALKERPYLELSIQHILKEGLHKGEQTVLTILEPSTLTEEFLTLNIVGKETLKAMGREREVYKVEGSMKGMEILIYVGTDGEILKEESLGLTFIRENKEKAVKLGPVSFDLVTSYSVPFNMKLPEGVSYLKIRLKGIDVKNFVLDGDNQRLTGDVLEVFKTPLSDDADVFDYDGEKFKEYLSDSLFIKPSDTEISKKAREITKGATNSLKKARLIFDWVYENIVKAPALTIPTATEVLKKKKGDCNEHTALYTALARASGVPTRAVVGLVYQDGSFYYHAWPEIYLDRWISIDPTLGQWPSDATHIRLIIGDFDSQMKLAGVVGKLKIEGIEYK